MLSMVLNDRERRVFAQATPHTASTSGDASAIVRVPFDREVRVEDSSRSTSVGRIAQP